MGEITVEQTEAQVAALYRELAGYESRGRDDRADQVRAEIARLTGTTVTPRPSRKQADDRLAGKAKTTRTPKETR